MSVWGKKYQTWTLTFFDYEICHEKGHGVPWVYVVSTVDMLAIDRESHSRQEFKNPLRNLQSSGDIKLGGTLVMGIRLGEHGDVHGHSTVEVMQAAKEEDAAEDNETETEIFTIEYEFTDTDLLLVPILLPVLVEERECERGKCGNHDDDFWRVQTPTLIVDIVEDNVGKWGHFWHSFVGQGQAGGCSHPGKKEENESKQGLDWLFGDDISGIATINEGLFFFIPNVNAYFGR